MSAVPQKGDWVSFISNNRIVIAEVRYSKLGGFGTLDLFTDWGETNSARVLEVRKPTPEPHHD